MATKNHNTILDAKLEEIVSDLTMDERARVARRLARWTRQLQAQCDALAGLRPLNPQRLAGRDRLEFGAN